MVFKSRAASKNNFVILQFTEYRIIIILYLLLIFDKTKQINLINYHLVKNLNK